MSARDATTEPIGEATAGKSGRRATTPGDSHVLIVDDDARIRALLRRFLERDGFRVSEARDAAHARRLVASLGFDMLVVDVMMPGEDGLSFTRWVDGRIPILLLTAKGEIEARIEGLEAGADDYLAKPFEPKELSLRIEAILRRAMAQPPSAKATILKLGDARFDVERGELSRDGASVRLTTAEIAMLRYLARRVNEPVSRFELLAELSPGERPSERETERLVQDRAIDVQVTRLRRKIEPSPREPRYLKTIRGAGYMLSPDAG